MKTTDRLAMNLKYLYIYTRKGNDAYSSTSLTILSRRRKDAKVLSGGVEKRRDNWREDNVNVGFLSSESVRRKRIVESIL